MQNCKASVVVRETLFLLDKGLEDLQCLWHDFANNVEEYCLGDRGVSRSMQHIWRNMAVAWWLPDIVAQPQPDSAHQRALLNLYSAMKPELQLTPWPGDEYASAPSTKQWPNRAGIQHFYKIWWAKVHEAAKQEYRAAWFPVTHYIVVSPRQLLPIAMLCRAKLAAGSAAEAKSSRILERLSAFCAAPFRLQASDVVGGPFEPGQLASLRRRRGNCKHTRAAVGSAGQVWISSCIRTVDQQRLAASLEQCADFARGCYYVNDWFCRCRRVGSTEAPCERWVGCLKYLYNPITGPTTTTLTERCRMRLAGVRGDGSDEAFVHMLSAKMHAESKTRRANKTLSRYKQAASASSAGTARGFMAGALQAASASSVAVVGTGRRGHAVLVVA